MTNPAEISFAAYWELSRLNASAVGGAANSTSNTLRSRHAVKRENYSRLLSLSLSPSSPPLRPFSPPALLDIDIFPRRRVSFSPPLLGQR